MMIKRTTAKCLFAIAAFVAFLASKSFGQSSIVHTRTGDISGTTIKASQVVSFKGIPYAEPPIGDLRWKPPVAMKPWKGVRSGSTFGASCMQRTRQEFLPWTAEFLTHNRVSEDCLYLNVWTPNVSPQANLPVIVFIHGGGFSEGAGDVAVYDGENLAATGLVVVTINYRLGVFGFLALPALTAESAHHSSGNYGLLDQIASLHWVKDNIRNLGGDPHRVTIWGQSAGAFSVSALIASPLAAGLFQRAMADSGISLPTHPMADLKTAEDRGSAFAAAHHAASLNELRDIPAEAFLPGQGFSPVVDGWVLPESPAELSERGADNDVPVITGNQANDGLLSIPATLTLKDFHEFVKKQFGDSADQFEKLYPAHDDAEAKQALLQASRDRNRISVFLWASNRMKNHRQPVFTYFFTRAIPWPQHPEYGAFHTGEIPYFFLNLDRLDRPWQEVDRSLSKSAAAYLKSFAATGNPNVPGLANWAAVHADHPATMELGSRIGPMHLADKAQLDFWMRFFNSHETQHAPMF